MSERSLWVFAAWLLGSLTVLVIVANVAGAAR